MSLSEAALLRWNQARSVWLRQRPDVRGVNLDLSRSGGIPVGCRGVLGGTEHVVVV